MEEALTTGDRALVAEVDVRRPPPELLEDGHVAVELAAHQPAIRLQGEGELDLVLILAAELPWSADRFGVHEGEGAVDG
eukprot:12355071-Alexandrium_andersonii.AAC.1